MSRRSSGSTLATAVALAGGLAFGTSLVFFILAYVAFFDARPVQWTTQTGLMPTLKNVGLFTAFAIHHSVLARSGVKQLLAAVLPEHLERASYVLVASLLFLAVCWRWQPVPGVIWSTGAFSALPLAAVQIAGVLLTLRAASRIDILDLAGVRQALDLPAQNATALIEDGLYGIVRHPVYLGWLLIVWPTPTMTVTRFTFAAISTLYLVVAIPWEERGLAQTFGQAFDDYRARVRWRMVPFVY